MQSISPMTEEHMSRLQIRAASIISGLALLLVLIHIIWPAVISLDQGTLVLLALASVPWLPLFYKKLKIPGFAEAETHERSQGQTDAPLPPAADRAVTS